MSNFSKTIFLSLYYVFGAKLPNNETKLIGNLSRFVRRACVRKIFKNVGKNVNINKGAIFGRGSNITLGDFSSIGRNCQVSNDTVIGANVMMAPEVIIFSVTHKTDEVDIPMRLQGNKPSNPVTIGNDVWIGQRAIILPGVVIGDGAIIGAGSVVTKSVACRTVVAGNPARLIKARQ
ncbi:hypothetical protein BCS94_09940 [Vibrio breoganii]|nr:DapH/DapD/GlmU-related protein [Vibrio breoganii]PMP07277.1 hypothetical protein BCS94_09940 [Vibrio breoganii]